MVDEPEANAAPKVKVQFNYIKGPNYREVPCHGAIGGVTPQGKLWLAFFAERGPLPRIIEYEVPAPPTETPFVGLNERDSQPTSIDSRQGIIRHVEFSAYLDIDAALRIRDWLTQRISEIEATPFPVAAAPSRRRTRTPRAPK